MEKKILIITSANLTTNPRLLKELKVFSRRYTTLFLGFCLGNWSDAIDEKHRKGLSNIYFKYLSATRRPFIPWFLSTLVQIFSRKLYRFFPKNLKINSYAVDKRSWLMKRAMKSIKADLVIAHNMGALYPAWWYSKKYNVPFAFDMEDYHPGEKIHTDSLNEKNRRKYLLKKLLPDAHYLSYASPMIGSYGLKLVGGDNLKSHFLVNNAFSYSEFIAPETKNGKLKLVWFSQYIDAGRGLEGVLPIFDAFHDQLELHLFGSLRDNFYNETLKHRKYISIHKPVSQMELHHALADYDIGLALESIHQDLNRDICLTNKIIAYSQAGLYILATDTKAQKDFIEKNPQNGLVISTEYTDLYEKMEWVLDNTEGIRQKAQMRYELNKRLSFENESLKLINSVKEVL